MTDDAPKAPPRKARGPRKTSPAEAAAKGRPRKAAAAAGGAAGPRPATAAAAKRPATPAAPKQPATADAPKRPATAGTPNQPATAGTSQPKRRPAAARQTPETDPMADAPQTHRDTAPEPTTHFGYQTVPEGEKAGRVHGVFSSVASRYDLMNDLMSARIHRLWKEAMVDWLKPRPGMRALDVAGGTGDIAFRILRRVKGEAEVTVCDLTQAMLDEGQRRAEQDHIHGIDWVCGDAMALPFADSSFDTYTIAFGIRNVTRMEDALAEAFRVLKPGGRFLCLEFSHIPQPLLQKAYDLYSFNVIPTMGKMITGDRESYQYLVESIRQFPDQERFKAMIEAAGFSRVAYRNLTLGVAALHSGWKI